MDITSSIITSFRGVQLAFADDTKWPDAIVENALYEADAETGGSGWGGFEDEGHNFKRRGMYYYAAHWLSTTYLTQDAGDTSNVSPNARLNVSQKSVGDESIQYRITAMQETGDDWLSLTNYGVQFLRLRRRAGMGARAV
ncbi:MAG TPA: DUF4054 domain-containing protein [Methylophaga aminisulfidivorans]|uniref:DUF4054 domain-containing protein n=2 Tax=root TaxID=1 RepID=A0A7C1W5K2_9GAMM|nr:DUF4054 domain-containing protein [Methylophaga aminisulfidivorans]HEC73118.1 DUF4054 domain-containing protein [Methylophaga aminisulfidivorans]